MNTQYSLLTLSSLLQYLLVDMGNEHPKYETTYYAWQQYRSKIKSSTHSSIPVSPKSQSNASSNSTTLSGQMKDSISQSSTRQQGSWPVK